MTPEPSDPKPSFSKTYATVAGDPIGDHGWVTDLEYFAHDDDPVELIEETWQRTAVRTFWHLPRSIYSCAVGIDCDEDAVDWRMLDDEPVPACKYHGDELPEVPT